MRRLIILLTLALTIGGAVVNVCGQAHPFTSDSTEYALELPGTAWRTVTEPDSVHQHAEFVYGDRNDGFYACARKSWKPARACRIWRGAKAIKAAFPARLC
jgi:hypothetical protein